MPDLLKNLNDEQRQAVTFGEGPLLIVAGAGTGKTAVITSRLAHLIISKECHAEEVLALTFTDKAAGEMEERADRLLPYGYVDLWISTFHAFAERLLKEHGLKIGLSNDFKLFNTTQQWLLVKKNLDKFNLDYYRPLGNPTKFIHALLRHFSRAKDENISPADYLKYAEDLKLNSDSAEFVKSAIGEEMAKELSKDELKELLAEEIIKQTEVANAYHTYQQLLLDNNALDFGDLINYCLRLLKERKNLLLKYQKQFKYILVDEFQDTNFAQYELLKLLAAPKNNITVVGDDDQCLPAEAKIKTFSGTKKIKSIKVGEKVLTAVGKGYLSYAKISKVFKNIKKTKFITFQTASGRRIKVTDNHKMFCFVPAIDDKKYYYVYLMYRQNLGWRLGVTNDLSIRLRLERSADKIIGIKAYNSETEARFYETLYSLKYNIPTVCFKSREGTAIKDQWLIKLYSLINTETNAEKLAKDLNIDLDSHHYSLAGVNRGRKIRIKINLEMCHRRYGAKAKNYFLKNPKVLHLLTLETSDKKTIKKLKQAGFELKKTKKGYRLRITKMDLKTLGQLALRIKKVTGGILELNSNIGRLNIQSQKALVMPAKNVLVGQYLPILTGNGVIYDRVIEKKEEKEKLTTVYDLEIENTHNFIADNIIVHNSIYKFRGASISNILKFKDDYPNAKEIFLNRNYRSRQNILDLSYRFIQQNNPYRLEVKLADVSPSRKATATEAEKLSKKLIAQVAGEAEIIHFHGQQLSNEVRLVIEKIISLREKAADTNWSDFAILVRANASADDFCYALEQAGIPYDFVASKGLYRKKVVLDLMAYLKLLDNYHEGPAMYRVLSMPIWAVEPDDLVNLNYWAARKSWSLYETLKKAVTLKNLSEEAKEKFSQILSLLDKHSQLINSGKNTSEIVQNFLIDGGYLKALTSVDSSANREQLNYLNQFYKKVQGFERENPERGVKNFLVAVEMELESGEEGSLEINWEESGPDTVKVMTAHSAKGLEFKYVFIANLVDKRFPTIERGEPIEIPEKLVKEIIPEGDIHLQEERRLFYVAMTRAKEGLYFTSADDYGGARKKKLSRFLSELEPGGLKLSEKAKPLEEKITFTSTPKTEAITYAEISEFVPTRFSFTQLKAFETCPYQYRFAHILKVPARGNHHFSFGKSLHNSLHQFFQLLNQKEQSQQADLFGGQGAPLLAVWEELEAIYEKSFIGDWYLNRAQKNEYFIKGKKNLKEFFELHQGKWPKVRYLEYPFNFKIKDDESYAIFGFIDRVDEVDGGIKVIDYKTGNVKSELSFEDKEQLLIYQLALKEILAEPIKELSFYYLEENKEAGFLGEEKDLKKIEAKIITTIEEIKKNKFPPKPGMICQYCDYKSICEFRA